MNENEMKVYAKDVIIGMYISRIDRPWLDSPFILQGFMINDHADRRVLIENCDYCYIDIERSKVITKYIKRIDSSTKKKAKPVTRPVTPPPLKPNVTVFKRKRTYTDTTTATEELSTVDKIYNEMTPVVKEMMDSLKIDDDFELGPAKEVIKPMVDSIIRNPDALLWINRLRQLDDYDYSHSLGCSVWSMAMGRQLGLNRVDIEALGLGGLIFDIGKTRIPDDILNKTGLLNEKEVLIIQSHVQHSLDIILKNNNLNLKVRQMIEHHHEKVDGSGYPQGLIDNQIPLFARIAGIIDCYDAITSKRCYAKTYSAQDAIKMLYELRGKDYQDELVEEFIQAVGMFPAGTLVELSTGEVAVVVNESRLRRLRPKIMMLLNADKSKREDYIMCNMMHKTKDDDGEPLDIKRALPIGSFGIKADDYFL